MTLSLYVAKKKKKPLLGTTSYYKLILFFYFSRKDLGSVGAKFFEGVTKHSYLKKLKKKLNDCKTFFEAKCNNTAQVVTPEKKQWFDNLAK